MKKVWTILALVVLVAFSVNFASGPAHPDVPKWNDETPVYEVLKYLGQSSFKHEMANVTPEMIRMGEELVKEGRTVGPNGKRTSYISKHYVCTSCHNMEIEDPNLRISDPDARLNYAKQHDLPFRQATTFYGMVNRESWYNDDYFKKYGDLVKPANGSIREALQLCAVECSQGRSLKKWEEDAILAYSWSLQYKMGDLGLNEREWKQLRDEAADPARHEFLRNGLKTFYNLKSPATFLYPPSDKKQGYGLNGNAIRGKDVYELGCQQCHKHEGVSMVVFDDHKLSFQQLYRHIDSNTPYSIYEIIRLGTHAEPGSRPYMPHYTKERMSDQQVEDLRAYIEEQAKG